MDTSNPSSLGFSTVELLVTLFVGVLFVIMGYQLQLASVAGSREANNRSTASISARGYLDFWSINKAYFWNATPACNALPAPYAPTYNHGYGPVSYVYTITCPDATNMPTFRKYTVKATYRGASATHATYVTVP